MRACVCVCVYVYARTCMPVYVCVRKYLCVCVYVCVWACVRVYVYARTTLTLDLLMKPLNIVIYRDICAWAFAWVDGFARVCVCNCM